MAMSAPESVVANGGTGNRNQTGTFAIMTLLFFLWGFLTVWNDLLIPEFKESFDLTHFQAMLVQFAFFGAYTIGSLIYFLISATIGDPISRIGYRNGVIIGLSLAAAGCGLFVPAAQATSYPLFLAALFVVGLGFTMLQIAANPYITILGPERTASSRLNLAQAFNSLGTTISPIIGGWLIFTVFANPGAHGAAAVSTPYLILALVFATLAVVFRFLHLPDFQASKPIRGAAALRHPHMVLGMLAIFMYVGGEVSIGSSIVNFLGDAHIAGLQKDAASPYLAFFWGGLMIGRFMGAIAFSGAGSRLARTGLLAAVLIAAFVIIGLVSGKDHSGWENAQHYGVGLGLLFIAFLLSGAKPGRSTAVFSAVIIGLLTVAMLTTGVTAMWAVLSVGLFCSVMWSNVFSLAIEGLGPLKSQASSLLVCGISGGALLPPLQGLIADKVSLQWSFLIPAVAFAYVGFYGLVGCRIGRRGESA